MSLRERRAFELGRHEIKRRLLHAGRKHRQQIRVRYLAADPRFAALHFDRLRVAPPLLAQHFHHVRGRLVLRAIRRPCRVNAGEIAFAQRPHELPRAQAGRRVAVRRRHDFVSCRPFVRDSTVAMRAGECDARTNAVRSWRSGTLEKSVSRRAGTPRDERTGSANGIGNDGRENETAAHRARHKLPGRVNLGRGRQVCGCATACNLRTGLPRYKALLAVKTWRAWRGKQCRSEVRRRLIASCEQWHTWAVLSRADVACMHRAGCGDVVRAADDRAAVGKYGERRNSSTCSRSKNAFC